MAATATSRKSVSGTGWRGVSDIFTKTVDVLSDLIGSVAAEPPRVMEVIAAVYEYEPVGMGLASILAIETGEDVLLIVTEVEAPIETVYVPIDALLFVRVLAEETVNVTSVAAEVGFVMVTISSSCSAGLAPR